MIYFKKRRDWWAGRDLNSRPFGYQPNALAKLSHRPGKLFSKILCYKFYIREEWLSFSIEGLCIPKLPWSPAKLDGGNR